MPEDTSRRFERAPRAGFGPGAYTRELHEKAPLSKIEMGPIPDSDAGRAAVWMVTGYHEVRQVLGDHVRFSNSFASGPPDSTGGRFRPPEVVGHLMDYDPPEHTRLRRMLTPAFTVRRMRQLEPRIEEVVARCLDGVAKAGQPVDLVDRFARPVSGEALCELLGVPRDDRGDFVRWVQWQLEMDRPRRQRADAGEASLRYLGAMVRRLRKQPDDSFIGTLVREHGDAFTDEELRGVCGLMMLAGLDNVSGMISLGILVLLRHPDQLAALCADAASADRVVDELLRYLSVAHAPQRRIALEDVTVADQVIKKGEQVMCSIQMANRDPALLPDADRFDSTRDPVPHVAFGHGIHHCIGAAMSRMELRIAYRALWHRFPTLRPAVPEEEITCRTNAVADGLTSLPVTW
ncbi:cytochrome P450 [Streptomyces sp. NPDC018019]|uniref:cytochrome P450 n=1 Tax=Streptomyces sp. NPDC018019 TaxID=3365030 RepID=UPI0037B01A72